MASRMTGYFVAVLIAPFYLMRRLVFRVLQSLEEAVKRGYFKVVYGASVHTRNISLSAKLGKYVTIGKDCVVGENVSIGDYSYLNERTTVDSGTIGKFCSIASGVSIGPAEHPTHRFSTHPATYSEARYRLIETPSPSCQKQPPKIGNDVWIGRNAVVRRGVNIGNGAVVGANSVVCDDVSEYHIVGGIPSRILRSRFSEEKARMIKDSEWWDHLEKIAALESALSEAKDVR